MAVTGSLAFGAKTTATPSAETTIAPRSSSAVSGQSAGALPRFLQAKLAISQPGDPYEQEADRIADQVMQMPEPSVQRACASCSADVSPCPACNEEEEINIRRKGDETPDNANAAASPLTDLGQGRPLDPATRYFFEARFAEDFSQVRLHTDSRAADSASTIHARAYTLGRDVVFSEGEFSPATAEGKRLLAHELAHVVQQRSAGDATPQGMIQRDVPLWWREFLENNRIDFTVSPTDLDLPVVGTPRAGVRRNPNGTWTMVIGNDEHLVGVDEIDDILGSIGGGSGTTGGPGPRRPGLPTTFDPTTFACPIGDYYDFIRLRCQRDEPAASGIDFPTLTLPEFPSLPPRPSFSLLNTENVTIDHFELDSSAIPSDSSDALDRLIALLNSHRDADVRIDGHTDTSGTPEHNQTLSEGRAEAIRDELVRRGVTNPERLRTRGIGARVLWNPEERTEEERAENRRVEVWFDLPPGEIAERFRLLAPPLTLPPLGSP